MFMKTAVKRLQLNQLLDSTSTDLLLSFGSPTKHLDGENSQVPSDFSTLERDSDCKGEVCADGEAPLALPEKGGSTSASSIISISPERVVDPGFAKMYDARDRRSTTLSSNTRSTRSSSTLILDHQDANGIIKEEAEEKPMTSGTWLEKEEPTRQLSLAALTPTNAKLSDDELISPTTTELSDNTIASSCSLQMISQISSTPPSPMDVQNIFK
uniref:Uncharacterized protein n=1 Tax=Ditylenchus dipsaci TaxID=166011 RepID=A0A915EPA1_9BILA